MYVYCLVRADSIEEGENRLKHVAAQYAIELNFNKVQVILGDLNQELGLTIHDQTLVSDQTDAIYHCGASVNFIADHDALKTCNVDATVELMKLCLRGNPKQFNFISTKGVFTEFDDTIDENSSLVDQIHYRDRGYESSKWVADHLIKQAQEKGINANIFRLGRITADTSNGRFQNKDFFYRFLRASLQLKSFPMELLSQKTDLTPVDQCAYAIVELAMNSEKKMFPHGE